MDNSGLQSKQVVEKTEYEKTQEFNAVTSWLHSFRYRHLVAIFSEMFGDLDRPIKIFEIGAASGKLFSILNPRFDINYVGVELRSDRVEAAQKRYQHHANFSIICGRAEEHVDTVGPIDAIVALETMEHIPEDVAFRLIEAVAANEPKTFICSVPNEVGPMIWVKNIGSFCIGYHKRYKGYTWKETFWAGLYKLDKVRPHGTGHRGFDWRWLAHSIRHNMTIVETRALPLNILPLTLSPTIMFIAKPRSK